MSSVPGWIYENSLKQMSPQVSIVITTHNRCDDLRRALRSCEALTGVSFEILVYDDASVDGTLEMVKEEFPNTRLLQQQTRQGYIRLRNQGFRESLGEFVISIDDDAEFTDPKTLLRIVALFRDHPQAAALALPFVEPNRPTGTMSRVPAGTSLRNYIGCAHAIRRSIAIETRGYPEILIHQGEERDLCIRLLDRHHEILFADTGPIIHHASPNRSLSRLNYYGYRNTFLFCWMRFPFPYALGRIAISTVQLLGHKFRWYYLPRQLLFIGAGYFACVKYIALRNPVSIATYKRYRSLPSHGPIASSEFISSSATCELPKPADLGEYLSSSEYRPDQ